MNGSVPINLAVAGVPAIDAANGAGKAAPPAAKPAGFEDALLALAGDDAKVGNFADGSVATQGATQGEGASLAEDQHLDDVFGRELPGALNDAAARKVNIGVEAHEAARDPVRTPLLATESESVVAREPGATTGARHEGSQIATNNLVMDRSTSAATPHLPHSNLDRRLFSAPDSPISPVTAKLGDDAAQDVFKAPNGGFENSGRILQTPAPLPGPVARAPMIEMITAPDLHKPILAAISMHKSQAHIEVRLDPPELGRIKIDFEGKGADLVRAVISAETTETFDLLRRHGDVLAKELERAGLGRLDLQFESGADFHRRTSDAHNEAVAGDGEDQPASQLSGEVRRHYRIDRLLDQRI